MSYNHKIGPVHFFLVTICLFTIVTGIKAQTSSLPGREADSMRLRYLNDQYIQSWIKSDTATYNRLLWAKEFVHLSAGTGKLISRPVLAPIFGAKRFDTINFFYADSVEIRLISDSVAFIYAVTPYQGKGVSTVDYSRYNDVYVKQADGWKCVAANTVSMQPNNFLLPKIKAQPPQPVQLTMAVTAATRSAVLLLNRDWVHAFAKNDKNFLSKNRSIQHWVTYPDGNLDKGMLKEFRFTALPSSGYAIANETIEFPHQRLAIVRNVLTVFTETSAIKALQMCNYYFYTDGKWELVSFNATAIQD